MYEDMEKFTKIASKQLKLGKGRYRAWDVRHRFMLKFRRFTCCLIWESLPSIAISLK